MFHFTILVVLDMFKREDALLSLQCIAEICYGFGT